MRAGRVPNTDRLNLATAGVQTDERGFIQVNERLETNVPGIYALGDVKGGPAFTHISYDDFCIIRTNLLEDGNATTTGRLVPYTVFIDPQLGRVGLSEREARAQGRNIRVAKIPMSYVARALEVDETRGLLYEGRGGCRYRPDPRCGYRGHRGRRSGDRFADGDDGQRALHCSAGRSLRPPDPGGVIEQSVHDLG